MHASQLIASGVDMLTISRWLGHGLPTITLGVYGHLFANAGRPRGAGGRGSAWPDANRMRTRPMEPPLISVAIQWQFVVLVLRST
jgi:hypothetical protein